MDYTELTKELLSVLIRIDNYKNIVEATARLSDSALLCKYLQDNKSATIKEIQENTNIPYEKIYETVRSLIDKKVVSYTGFLSLNENSTISLTDKGTEEIGKIHSETVAFACRQLKKLSPSEAEQFVEYALKIINTDSPKE